MHTTHRHHLRVLNRSLAAAFGTTLSLWSGIAFAQSNAPSPEPQEMTPSLPTVTVNADGDDDSHVSRAKALRSTAGSKTETPIIEVPQSLSVVTSERIQTIGATNVRDALGYTPGITISPFGADSRYDWISIRGFDSYSPGFYQDGLPLRNANTFAVWRVEPYGAERIDVLRGPASVLYGQGGPGGVVDVTSKFPTKEPIRELQLQYGSHGHKQVAGDFSGAFDADGTVQYRIVGLARDAELPAGGERNNRLFLAPSLTVKFSSDTTLTTYAQLMRNRSGVYTRTAPIVGSLLPTPIGTRIPSSLFNGNPHFDRFNQDQEQLGYKLEHRFNDTFMFRQNLRAGHMKLDYRGLQAPTFATVNPGNPLAPENFSTINVTPFGSRESLNGFSLDNQLQANLRAGNWQHNVVLGVDYQRNRINTTGFSGGSAPPISIDAPKYPDGPFVIPNPYVVDSTRLTQTGIYLQDQIKWADRWALTLGGRYDQARSNYVDRLKDVASTNISNHKFTSRAGLVYLAPNGLAPYASYTQSFSPITAINPLTKRPFDPETGRQYEVGMRYQPVGTSDMYSAAVFDLRRRNYVTFDPNFVPYQTGEISVRGMELEASTRIMRSMNLTAAYTYTQRAIVTASANPDQIGKQAQAVPRNQLSLWGDYRFSNRVRVGLGARYVGATRGNGGITPVKIPSFMLMDAMISYDIENWSLALNLRNLTNKTYLANCDGQAQTCYYGDQRSAMATATYRW